MTAATPHKGVVVITGTSSGIGRATALLLDRSGYRVFAGVRKPSDGDALRSESSPLLEPLILEITSPEQVAAAVETVSERLGPEERLHALVNNAGIAEAGPLECIDLARVRRQFEVNVYGHLAVTQAFLPLLHRGPGRIVTVVSAVVDSPMPFLGPYCSSKAALRALFLSLRRELWWFGIPVSMVMPGFITGPIWDSATAALARIEREDVDGRYLHVVKKMYELIEFSESMSAPADVVARTIYRVLRARRPRAEYRCGPGSQLSRIGNWLPESLVHAVLKWHVHRKSKTDAVAAPSADVSTTQPTGAR
jgi:NAD(P)-dependent dehydrogenase (short-subunit alcohol dehydrogenase family)